jgi:hypothetical protein
VVTSEVSDFKVVVKFSSTIAVLLSFVRLLTLSSGVFFTAGVSFGFALGFALDFAFALGLAVAFAFDLGLAVAFAFALGLAVAFAFALGLAVAFAFALGLGFAFAFALGLAVAFAFALGLGFAFALVFLFRVGFFVASSVADPPSSREITHLFRWKNSALCSDPAFSIRIDINCLYLVDLKY